MENYHEKHDFMGGLYYESKCRCDSCLRNRLDLHAKVARGAELLDSVVPDWYLKVNLEILDLDTCPFAAQRARGVKHLLIQVLGSPEVTQNYQALDILFKDLGLMYEDAHKYGFIPKYHGHPALNMAWMEVIVRRHVESVE